MTLKVIAKPLETSQTSVAAAEKWRSGGRVHGKFGGFAITSSVQFSGDDIHRTHFG